MQAVASRQRYSPHNRCPVCDGAPGDPRGKERRCFGFTSSDGLWAHCTREELAGNIDRGADDCFAHRLSGSCKCGRPHKRALTPGLATIGVERRPAMTARQVVAATYPYLDEKGALLYQVVRYEGKEFRQRRPDGQGGWIYNLNGVERVLYKLPDVLGAADDRPIYVVEGEKDVDALAARGHVATCNPMGAGKWSGIADHAERVLSGRDVIVIADADKVGREHAEAVCAALKRSARSVRGLECPEPHKDVSDLFFARGALEDLVELGTRKEPSRAQIMAPEIPFDELWTPEPTEQLIIPSLGIAPGPVHLVTGTWYTGKTLLLATMGLSVAAGRSLFGLFGVTRGKWIHFDHEMGRRHLKRYLQRLRAGMGVDPEDLRGNISARVLPSLNLRTEGAVELYTELLTGCAIATIDPLRAAAPGADENKSEFREYLDMLSVVSERARCAIVVLHHGGKPGMVESTRRNTGRGTSAIDDACQSKWVLSATEKGAPMLVTHEKTRELNEPMPDFYLKIVNLPGAVRLEHLEVEQMEQSNARADEAKEAGKLANVRVKIQKLFIDHGGTLIGGRGEIVKLAKGDRGTVQKAISLMVQAGELVREGKYGECAYVLRSTVPDRSEEV